MIDCENEVYTRIVRMLREEFPGINVAGEYTKTPSSFPHVSITQSDNSTIADKQDTSGKEAMSLVMFEINVYSNKSEGKKTECKSIAKAIDEKMFSMNFRRFPYMKEPIPITIEAIKETEERQNQQKMKNGKDAMRAWMVEFNKRFEEKQREGGEIDNEC